ncbi:MAG: hypothetical protein GXP62_19450 [Oligoflexia bacterium]|nr:hypothetical protein [Oligoflexia bacterium]
MIALGLLSQPALAIPAFARKYGTSCETCHTVFPRLNPFGEAFRRDGLRFPEADDEMVKQRVLSMGSQAYKRVFPKAVWPSTLPGQVPLALAVHGEIRAHPDTGSSAARADDGAALIINDLVDSVSLLAAGSFDAHNTFYADIDLDQQGVVVDSATVHFNDLLGTAHTLNLIIGQAAPTTSSFGTHSSYIDDRATPSLAVTALYGRAPDAAWALGAPDKLIELNGLVAGRFDWSMGLEQGKNARLRTPQDVYAHMGVRLGGLRMDGEAGAVTPDDKPRPGAAITLAVNGARSSSQATDGSIDTALSLGGSVRAELQALVLDASVRGETHDDVDGAGLGVSVLSQVDELSVRVFPWLFPVVRTQWTMIHPDDGSATLSDLRLSPGVAALARANLKFVLLATVERSRGAPPAGWGAAMGTASPTSPSAVVSPELESVRLRMTYAY